MMTLVTLFFFSILSTSYSLMCIRQDKPLELELPNYNYKKFAKKINDLPSNTRTRCRVEMSIDHENIFLTISFSKSLTTSNWSDHKLQFETSMYVNIRPDTRVTKNLEYACSGQDNCEREFVLKHLEWFVQANFITLHTSIYLLLKAVNDKSGTYFDIIIESFPKNVKILFLEL